MHKAKKGILILILVLLVGVVLRYSIFQKHSQPNKSQESYDGYGLSVSLQYPFQLEKVLELPDSRKDLVNLAFITGLSDDLSGTSRYGITVNANITSSIQADAYVRKLIKIESLGYPFFIKTKSITVDGIVGTEYQYSYGNPIEYFQGPYDPYYYITVVIHNSKAYFISRGYSMYWDYDQFRSQINFNK